MKTMKRRPKSRASNPRTGKKRTYTDRERAAVETVWEFTGRNMAQTSRLTGVPASTLAEWLARPKTESADIRAETIGWMIDALKAHAQKLFSVDPEQIADLKYADVVAGLGVVTERLLHLLSLPVLRAAEEQRSQLDLTRLTPDQLSMFASLTMKAYGRPEVPEASDLRRPVIMDPTHPNGWYTLDLDAAPADPTAPPTPEVDRPATPGE
jgi:lambda repressor-like predicted transcriptional regulator